MRIKIDCLDNVVDVEYSGLQCVEWSIIAINLFDLSPSNSLAYNVQFSLSSEILAPSSP